MKRFRFGFCCMLIGCITAFMTACVLANSSWVWISETRPLDLLPIVIAGTLLIEVAAVLLAMRKQKFWKVLFFVTLGNLLSFAAPYLYNYLSYSSVGFSFLKYLDHWPSYTVGIIFLSVTILIELPIVWLSLRKDAKHPVRFALVIIAANVLTTGLTALAERLICSGHW